MAKHKLSKAVLPLPPWWRTGFVPCVCRDPASAAGGRYGIIFMLAPTFEGTLAVQRIANMPGHTGVRDRVVPNEQMKHYTVIADEENALQSFLLELKSQMLTEGATREAVRLVGELIPITDKEYKIMAEKLKTPAKKAPAAKAPAAKAPAKAPAPKAEGTGRGRASTLDEKAKLALTEKGQKKVDKAGKDDKLAQIAKAKTVGNALKIDGVLPRDIHYAVKTGLLDLS